MLMMSNYIKKNIVLYHSIYHILAIGVQDFTLCGHSLGGYVITTYLIKYKNPNCKNLIVGMSFCLMKE